MYADGSKNKTSIREIGTAIITTKYLDKIPRAWKYKGDAILHSYHKKGECQIRMFYTHNGYDVACYTQHFPIEFLIENYKDLRNKYNLESRKGEATREVAGRISKELRREIKKKEKRLDKVIKKKEKKASDWDMKVEKLKRDYEKFNRKFDMLTSTKNWIKFPKELTDNQLRYKEWREENYAK